MSKLLHQEITGKVIGAAMEVHRILGCGFLEAVYEEALAHEMVLRKIDFERQKPLAIAYKDRFLREYICDFLVESQVIVELKAMRQLTEIEEAQILNYLKASKIRVGLLFNFGEGSLNFRRVVL